MTTPTRTVRIPACSSHAGFYGRHVTLEWVCPVCGGPRGEPVPGISYDGSRRLGVDTWENPCGHVDKYSALRREADAGLPAPLSVDVAMMANAKSGPCAVCGIDSLLGTDDLCLLCAVADHTSDDDMATLVGAAEALLDELHRVMPVWPATAQALAEQIGWDPPTAPVADVPEFLRAYLPEANGMQERATRPC